MNLQNTKIVGIDLGTTNSVISVLEGSNPTIIPNSEGKRTTPSVVAYTTTFDTALIGHVAKRQSNLNPENTFYSVKRFLGRQFKEIETEIKRVTYSITADTKGKILLYSPLLKKYFRPEEISAVILKQLIRDANHFLNESIKQAIITVPAYFNDSQRLATKDAGTIAGLDILRILNEPTAAALAYGFKNQINKIILIFDLGGGTFDVSILEVGNEIFEVIATSGDTYLGGDDFDNVIMSYILENFQKRTNIDLSTSKLATQRIREAAELTKIELSTKETSRILLPFITTCNNEPKHIDITLSRAVFTTLILPLLERCYTPLKLVLIDAKLLKNQIDEIILVGGSTRIPAIHNLISNFINKPIIESVNPDEVVAQGAAIHGGIIGGEINDLILLDVTPLSLGIETVGGKMTKVIPRNSSIPIKHSETFSTYYDNQQVVEIHVLQGEKALAKDNKSLGIFTLCGIQPAPRGIPKINITFQLDVNGLLLISARDKISGSEQFITITGTNTLPVNNISKNVNRTLLADLFTFAYYNLLCTCETLFYNLERLLRINNRNLNKITKKCRRDYLITFVKSLKSSIKRKKLIQIFSLIYNLNKLLLLNLLFWSKKFLSLI